MVTQRIQTANYKQNHGVPGVVYILENAGLRNGLYKIGCSRRSGSVRANELNADANTGTPGLFSCVFEYRTNDCGMAEERIFKKLSHHRRGKWGQEFFEIELAHAKESIVQICKAIDNEILNHPQPKNYAFSKRNIESINLDPINKKTLKIQYRSLYKKVVLGIIAFYVLIFYSSNENNKPYKNLISESEQTIPRIHEITNTREGVTAKNAPLSKAKQEFKPKAANDERNKELDSPTYQDEKKPIETTCPNDQYDNSSIEYNKCLNNRSTSIDEGTSRNSDTLELTTDEKSSIEAVCAPAKYLNGSLAYNNCLSNQLLLHKKTAYPK